MIRESKILSRLKALKTASKELRSVSSIKKNRVLKSASRLLIKFQNEIIKANEKDKTALLRQEGAQEKATPAYLDRLTLNPTRIAHMAESLRQVADLSDPVGEVIEKRTLKNGLSLRSVRSPLGVIFMIFESRPNVAVESFSLAFKAGNSILLKGGRESAHTTRILYQLLQEACVSEKLSENSLWGLSQTDRTVTEFLLKQREWIDVVVPRGGEGLIDFVTQHSQIPLIKNAGGICHVYLHSDGDLSMANRIVINAKTQRPGVCNAMETLLVHQRIANRILPSLFSHLSEHSVEWHACPLSFKLLKAQEGTGTSKIHKATQESWNTEYLDFALNCRIVESLDEAILHIDEHGSGHSEAIITASEKSARKFQSEVNAAVVYWNASTRFTDGFEFGLGGELGVSTQKLHVRGPVGLRELTSLRWVIDGQGQVRK